MTSAPSKSDNRCARYGRACSVYPVSVNRDVLSNRQRHCVAGTSAHVDRTNVPTAVQRYGRSAVQTCCFKDGSVLRQRQVVWCSGPPACCRPTVRPVTAARRVPVNGFGRKRDTAVTFAITKASARRRSSSASDCCVLKIDIKQRHCGTSQRSCRSSDRRQHKRSVRTVCCA